MSLVARPRLAPAPLARSPARPPVRLLTSRRGGRRRARALARRPAQGCWLQAAPLIAPSRWLAPHAVARAAVAAGGGEAAARGDGRTEDACAVGAAEPGGGEWREWEGGRAGRP